MKFFYILIPTLFLLSCQDTLAPQSKPLNFRAPNSVQESTVVLNYNYELQMADRAYVESVLHQVFDAKGTPAASYIETEIYRKMEFGGACDVYEASDLGPTQVEFSREQCFNGITVVQPTNNNPMRYSLTTKVCERLVKDSARMTAVRKKLYTGTTWKKPDSASIQLAWELFFPIHSASREVVSALEDIAKVSSSNEEAWKNIILTLCISPEWQAI